MTIKYCLNIQVDKLTLSFMYIGSTAPRGIKDIYRGVNTGQNLSKFRDIDSEEKIKSLQCICLPIINEIL